MTVTLQYDFSAYTQRVIVAWYKDSNHTAEIGRRVLMPPHLPGTEVEISYLERAVHRFDFYLSSDGTSLETLLPHTWYTNGTKPKDKVEYFDYFVGLGRVVTDPLSGQVIWQDPAPGDSAIVDKRLAGETFRVSKRMIGIMPETNYTPVSSGGFQLADGDTFEEGEHYVAIVNRLVEVSSEPSGGLAVNVVEASSAFDATMRNKKNVAAFTDLNPVTNFPPFAEIPDCVARFSTYSGNQRYWNLQFAAGDSVFFMNNNRGVIRLGRNEVLELSWKGGVCHVTDYTGKYLEVGEPFGGTRHIPGTWIADGGGDIELLVADFPRLFEELPSYMRCTYTQRNLLLSVNGMDRAPWRVLFAISADGTKFKVPDWRGYSRRYLKSISGSDLTRFFNGPGSSQAAAVNLSGIKIEVRNGSGGDRANGLGNGNNGPTGFAGMDHPAGWLDNDAPAGEKRYIRFTGGADETRTDNIGEIPLFWI